MGKTKRIKKPQPNNKATITLIGVFVVSALLAVFVSGLAFYFYKESLKPLRPGTDAEIAITVEPGKTIEEIADQLETNGIIKSSTVFSFAARINNKTDIAAGTYKVSAGMDGGKILNILTARSQIDAEVVLNFPGGSWGKEMAEAIAEQCYITADGLLNMWNDEEFIRQLSEKYWFIEAEPVADSRLALEGFLYPDTYGFSKDDDAQTITYVFLDRFGELVEPLRPQIETSKYSLRDILTIASLVQYDAVNVTDLNGIAEVYTNRYLDHQRLQSCGSLTYALYVGKDRQQCTIKKNQQLESPYNTFYQEGLPPGPAGNPTIIAIKAVLDQGSHNYRYYLYDKDGVIHFADSLAKYQEIVELFGGNE